MGRKKILIIDSDGEFGRSLEVRLSTDRFQIIRAENGVDGARKILRYHPDLITLDLVMPHLNGFQLMGLLQDLNLHIPTLIVTAHPPLQNVLSKYPDIYQICLKSEVETEFSAIVEQALVQSQRSYRDITYSLPQVEFMALLARSDRKKVLIVSDTITWHQINRMLGGPGMYFELYYARTAEEALFKSVFIRPDLILSEIDLPKGNGLTMASNLYILGHPFPIIFISNKTDLQTIKEVRKIEGIQGFLIKTDALKNRELLQKRVEETLNISEEEKARLKSSYSSIDPSKLEGIKNQGSDIDYHGWLSDLEGKRGN